MQHDDGPGTGFSVEVLTSVLGNGMLGVQIKLGKGDLIMEREEILKRAQGEKLDERELQVKDKSIVWSYIVMVIMAAIFSFVRSEQGLPMMDLCATVSGSVCAAMIYRFIKTKNKEYLLISVITLAITIMAIIRFCMGH